MQTLLLLFALLVAAPAAPSTPAAAEREGYFAADDGARIFYHIEGDGPQTLVVVHGGPGNSLESVRPDFGPLARGRRVIYYDQRGSGRSELIDDAARLGIRHHVADLEALRRHFGLERLTLLGNSWGGLLISAYAAAHPDRVERMVLDASAPPTQFYLDALSDEFDRRARLLLSEEERSRLHEGVRVGNWFEARDPLAHCRFVMGSFLKLYAYDPSVALPIRGDVCSGPTEAVRRQRLVNQAIWESMGEFDLRPAVARVRSPVLVLYGETDAIPAQSARDWAASYGDARLLVVARTGHLIHAERPDIFFPAIEQFLAGRWPAGAQVVSRPSAPSASRPAG